MTLILLLIAVVLVSGLLGVLAGMSPKELVGQTVAMAGAALAFYGLVVLL